MLFKIKKFNFFILTFLSIYIEVVKRIRFLSLCRNSDLKILFYGPDNPGTADTSFLNFVSFLHKKKD